MKQLYFFIVVLLLSIEVEAQSSYNYQKRFQVESGYVEYKLTGSVTGSKSLWWDDYGKKYREETVSVQVVKAGKHTKNVKTHSLFIADDKYYYSIDLLENKGSKLNKEALVDFSLIGSGMNDEEMEQFGEGLLKSFGGKVKKKSETVLGRTCDVTKLMGATVCVYKGVTLRSYAKMGSISNAEEALVFEENKNVPSSKFTPPRDIVLEDMSENVSGSDNFYEDQEEDDYSYPSAIKFEKFKAESERIRRKLGFSFAMHDASEGEYSSMWTKKDKTMIGISITSLKSAVDWQKELGKEGVKTFTNNGNRMAFFSEKYYDEESGTSSPCKFLIVELKNKDAFVRISAIPKGTKEELIAIFNQFKF